MLGRILNHSTREASHGMAKGNGGNEGADNNETFTLTEGTGKHGAFLYLGFHLCDLGELCERINRRIQKGFQ